MRDKVTRQCPQTTTFEEKGEPKRIRTEVPLLTSLTPYRSAKPVHYAVVHRNTVKRNNYFYSHFIKSLDLLSSTLRHRTQKYSCFPSIFILPARISVPLIKCRVSFCIIVCNFGALTGAKISVLVYKNYIVLL